jgi:aldose 1-epimerase
MRTATGIAFLVAGFVMSGNSCAAEASRAEFGVLSDGTSVDAVTLSNAGGIRATIIAWGATLQSLELPDRNGRTDDVVLGYADLDGYVMKPQYFGATVGRFANRIADARFVLDGKAYVLAANNGRNSLHGGTRGFDKVVWTITDVTSGPRASVTLRYVSPDGEEGYPGTLTTDVTYALDDDGTLTTRYEATTDAPTIINLSHHSLFNLAGAGSARSVLGQRLMIDADAYLPVDASLIPTGEIRSVAGTPFDFRESLPIGDRIRDGADPQIMIGRGYDHNYVLNGGASAMPKRAARFEDPVSGRVLELYTTEPGLQVYSGNFLDGTTSGKADRIYRQGDGLALEPQKFPDAPNQPAFPSARLDSGNTYRQTSYYRFPLIDAQ